MIRFECENCGRAVRVADGGAGKQGRCPYCKGLVRIPGPKRPAQALTAALGGETAGNGGSFVGPIRAPSAGRAEPSLDDDFQLPQEADDSLADTVILPAETHGAGAKKESRQYRPSR